MQAVIVLVLAAAGAVFSAGIASVKDRSVAAWALFGAVLPLIAGVAISFLPPRRPVEAS